VSAVVSIILSVLISVHLDSAGCMCCLVNNEHQSCSAEMCWHATHFVCSDGTQDVAGLTVLLTNWERMLCPQYVLVSRVSLVLFNNTVSC